MEEWKGICITTEVAGGGLRRFFEKTEWRTAVCSAAFYKSTKGMAHRYLHTKKKRTRKKFAPCRSTPSARRTGPHSPASGRPSKSWRRGGIQNRRPCAGEEKRQERRSALPYEPHTEVRHAAGVRHIDDVAHADAGEAKPDVRQNISSLAPAGRSRRRRLSGWKSQG